MSRRAGGPFEFASCVVARHTQLAESSLCARDALDPVAHYEVGMAHWDAEHWDAAERSFRRATALAPQYDWNLLLTEAGFTTSGGVTSRPCA